jgi:hypothetical protein
MSLTDKQWEIAHAIAIDLIKKNPSDRKNSIANEISKIVSYLRTIINRDDTNSRLNTYLTLLVREGDRIGYSNETRGYYESIKDNYSKYFQSDSNPQDILQVLGWVSRLMKYYKNSGVPIGEIPLPTVQSIQVNISTVEDKFKIGEIVEATVIKIDRQHVQSGKKTKLRTIITYQIQGSDCQPDEEVNKQEVNLSIGDEVKVKIEKCQGSCIRKVKRVIE